MRNFNDVVILSKNGVLLPAIVVKSQLQGDGREFLALLYADPATGPGLVLAGSTRKVGSIQLGVPPLSKGQQYGWLDLVVDESVLQAHSAAVIAGKEVPTVDFDEDDLPGVHGLPQQADESDEDKAARLANVAHQTPPVAEPGKVLEPPVDAVVTDNPPIVGEGVRSAPEQLDDVQGPVEPGDSDSPHAL